MPSDAIFGLIFLAFLIVIAVISGKRTKAKAKAEKEKVEAMSTEDREHYIEEKWKKFDNAQKNTHGRLNSAMVCPHCQSTGSIRTKSVKKKKGISGGKATAAVFTGGISILATGLSRKEQITEAYCDNCKNKWYF